MAEKIHGVNGLVYVSGSEIAYGNAWTLDISGEEVEVSVFGDTWKSRVRGLKDASGSITAWHDQDSKVLQNAATAAVSVALLLYPKRSDLTTYYSGNFFFDVSHDQDIGSAAKLTAALRSDGTLTLTGFS